MVLSLHAILEERVGKLHRLLPVIGAPVLPAGATAPSNGGVDGDGSQTVKGTA